MFRFFRSIRHKLLEENRFRNYILYAVGEIFLVVVGILIALQINTWNQNRLTLLEEVKTLQSLHSEFSDNLVKFDLNYEAQINRDRIVKRLLDPEVIHAPFESLDSLVYYLGWNFKFNPSTGIYTALINSGKIEIISNDSLKNTISNFSNHLVDFEEEENGANYYGTNFLTPYLRDQLHYRYPFTHRTPEQRDYDDENYRAVMGSDRTRSELLFYWSYMLVTLQEGRELRKQFISIIDMIETELADR